MRMAKQTTVHLVDDLDGGPAAENVQFSIDGRAYEVDLSEVHGKELRSALEPYIAAGRRADAPVPVRRRQQSPTSREQGAAIRRWARQQGMQIADRGRIPIEVQLRFDAAHAGGQG